MKMSLYLGNLSERTRRDELEHVFRRFGHCNLQLKREGYGFVVFDFPPDAEKALRALKGRNICGEPLTLTWSNRQPGHFQRFARGGRTYELQHARNSDRLGYARRKVNFNGWRNYKIGNVGRGKSVHMSGEEREYHQDDFKDYVGGKKDYGGDLSDDAGGVIPNPEDNGRWGEPIHDPSIDNGNENALEFDRYDPCHGYDRKHENENHHIDYSSGSPAANSQENIGITRIGEETSNHPNDSKYQQTCYRCGDSGHKMRNCPKEHSSHRKYTRFDVGLDDKIDRKHRVDDENKFGSSSCVRPWSSDDTLSMRHQRNERRVSGSRHYRMSLRNESSPIAKETDRHRRMDYRGKKQSRKEIESPKRSRIKKSRRSISSSMGSSSRSRSRPVCSRACSSSLNLRSSSKSQYSRGRSLNSTRSSSPTSLSVSLSHPLPSSPNKIQLNSKSLSINATALESVDYLVAQGEQIGSKMELENDQSKDTSVAVNGNAALYTTVVDAMEQDQYVQEDNNENHILLIPSDGATNLSKPLAAGNLSPDRVKETEGFWHSGTLVMDDIPTEIQTPGSEKHANPHSGHSTIISTEEMCMVLNHFGLELPKEDEIFLTMDAFFGSARLWPWHIVYYRRLKKGPISTENYARRVAQNREFGIVDKYIRSSSGWGEFNLENS